MHIGRPCQTPITCINCGGPHSARAKNCPRYEIEMAIQRCKTLEKLSYFEARKKIERQTPVQGTSYSQAAQKPSSSENEFMNRITPILQNIVKQTVSDVLKMNTPMRISGKEQMLPPSQSLRQTEGVLTRSRTTSDASSISKRRAISPVEDSDISGNSQAPQTDGKKKLKKKGWPKGKSRSTSNSRENASQQTSQNPDNSIDDSAQPGIA
nr:unnamed protein product [Callosobruchus chinensis]